MTDNRTCSVWQTHAPGNLLADITSKSFGDVGMVTSNKMVWVSWLEVWLILRRQVKTRVHWLLKSSFPLEEGQQIGFFLRTDSDWLVVAAWGPVQTQWESDMIFSDTSLGQQKKVSWHVYCVSSTSVLGLWGLHCHRTWLCLAVMVTVKTIWCKESTAMGTRRADFSPRSTTSSVWS